MHHAYAILGVEHNCTYKNLRESYYELVLVWHPDNHSLKSSRYQNAARDMLKDISNAYEVLSDPTKRKYYDQFPNSNYFEFTDPLELFEIIFDSDNLSVVQTMSNDIAMAKLEAFTFIRLVEYCIDHMPDSPSKICYIDRALEFTLRELYTGCQKSIIHTRKDSNTNQMVKTKYSIIVPPGTSAGQKIIATKHSQDVPQASTGNCNMKSASANSNADILNVDTSNTALDEASNAIKPDMHNAKACTSFFNAGKIKPAAHQKIVKLRITVKQKKHKEFIRVGDHLHAKYKPSESCKNPAVQNGNLKISTLLGTQVALSKVKLTEDMKMVLCNHGMPVLHHPGKFGDLVVHFQGIPK